MKFTIEPGTSASFFFENRSRACINGLFIGIGSKFGDKVCAVRCLREKSSGYFIVRKVWVRIH